MRVAYLVNTYPKPSHSFIRREIQALERLDFEVHRFAMRDEGAALVDPLDRAENARTEHVLNAGAGRIARAVAATVLASPRASLGALRLALSAGRGSRRGTLRHLVYLAEACYVLRRARALGVSHLHAHFGTNSSTVAMLVGALGGPGWSFTVHGPEEFDDPVALGLGAKMHRAAFAIAVSAFGRSQLCRWAEHADWPRLYVVHCGIEPALFPEPAPLPARGAAGDTRLVAVGRMVEQKGQLLLVEALAEVLAEIAAASDAHLEALGRAGRARALARHDVDREAVKLATLFRLAAREVPVGSPAAAVADRSGQRPGRAMPGAQPT